MFLLGQLNACHALFGDEMQVCNVQSFFANNIVTMAKLTAIVTAHECVLLQPAEVVFIHGISTLMGESDKGRL